MPLPSIFAQDVTSSAFKANPHPTYAQWRAQQPVVRIVTRGPSAGGKEAFLVSRYGDVSALLKDHRLVKDATNAGLLAPSVPGFVRPLMRNMLGLDDPDHARLKRLVQMAFTPKRIASIQGRIEANSLTLIEKVKAKGRFDLIKDYALAFPVDVISELLGVPVADRVKFARWSSAFISGGSSGLAMVAALPDIFAFLGYLKAFIVAKRANPGDDLVSDLVALEAEGDSLDSEELMAMISILLSAGHETTTNLIGNGMLALMQNPHKREELAANPDLIEGGIEELLRFAGPIATSTHRYAREDLQIAGFDVPKGALVLGVIASANRDEDQFQHAHDLDFTRTPNRHLTFGEGGHYCVGAALARLEGKIAFRHLLEHLPSLKPATDINALRWRPNLVLSGLKSFPVQIG